MIQISWSEGRWFPSLVKGGAMGTVGSFPVYACGMTYPWRETELAWYYDANRDDWFPTDPIPAPRCYTAGCSADNALVVVGGRKAGKDGLAVLNDAWALRRSSDSWQWTQLPPMAQARGVAGVAAVGTRILAVGGGEWEKIHGGAFTAETVTKAELLDLNDPGTGWRVLDVPFSPRAGCAAAAVGSRVYVFGGYTCRVEGGTRKFTYFDDTFSFDVSTRTWQRHSPLPGALSGHCAVSWGDRYVVLIGGVFRRETCGQMLAISGVRLLEKRKVLTGEYSDLVWVYDTITDTFTLMEERAPHGLNDVHACTVGDTIFAVGGENVDPSTSNTTDYVMLGKITGS